MKSFSVRVTAIMPGATPRPAGKEWISGRPFQHARGCCGCVFEPIPFRGAGVVEEIHHGRSSGTSSTQLQLFRSRKLKFALHFGVKHIRRPITTVLQ